MRHDRRRVVLWAALAALAPAGVACGPVGETASVPLGWRSISIADFGALADDGKDDTEAVVRAIRACRGRRGTVLVFPKGRYDFAAGRRVGRGIYQLAFEGVRGLIVDGRGSKLMFAGKTAPFQFVDCRDVTVRDLTIDWAEPLVSAGIIIRADKRSFDVALSREYTGEGSDRIESIIEFDPATRQPTPGGTDIYDCSPFTADFIKGWEKIGPTTLRVRLARDRLMTKGALAVIRHQVYRYNAFSVWSCRRFTLRDVTIRYCPGMGVSSRLTEDILLKRVRMAPPPGSPRILSVSADGTHFAECAGTIRIEDCLFQGIGDDATNIHGFFREVVRIVDGRTVEAKCQNTWIWPPRVSSKLPSTAWPPART